MKVLLVDDDADLLDVTAYALRREGIEVVPASDGTEALQRWQSERPDVVILDVTMPQLDGFEVCRTIRQAETTPIILLTGHTDDEHVVRGFQAGADDYVRKPFSPRELAMRVRAVWRRDLSPSRAPHRPVREVRVNDLLLELDSHQVTRGTRTIRLTPTEFRLLYMLAMNAGRVVGSTRLVEYAWGYAGGDTSLLKSHISHIRSKLQLPRGQPGGIAAVPGVGYSLTRT
jgi:DNA-binding response OmpR family regulator